MRHTKVDAIVVGGGPGGSAAAKLLADAGLAVALIDKARFPRDKLCGGLISDRSAKLLDRIFGGTVAPAYEHVSTGARLFFDGKPIQRISDHKSLRLTMRRTFDHQLVEAVRAAGVDVREEAAVTAVAADTCSVTLEGGAVLRADFIIGADGAASRVRKSILPHAMDKRGFATGVEIEVPRARIRRECSDPEIHLGCVRWGYGWVFPKRDTLTVGVAGLAHKNEDIRGACRAFMRKVLGFVPDQKLPGYPIPFGNHLRQPGVGNVLLVGDAAGFAEPITGEGIAFALQSACYAADAIVEAHHAGMPAAAATIYAARCKPLIRLFDDACLFRYLTFSKMTEQYFVKVLQASNNAATRYLDIVAADSDYREYLRYVAKTVITKFPKMVSILASRSAS